MKTQIEQGNFEAFFNAPFAIYGDKSPYVSPLKADLKRFLDPLRNPLMHGAGNGDLAFFTAHRDGKVLGRITAHEHGASNALHGLKRGYFGYFDVADDADAAASLLKAAEDWCRARRLSEIGGNFNLTAMQMVGVVTEGFEEQPYLDQVWSPPYLPGLLEANGYAAEFPMTTFEVDLTKTPLPQMGEKHKAILADANFSFAPITKATISKRMDEARQILNASFSDNPMFVPVSSEEFQFQAKDMKWIMDPRISAVMHFDGKPIACMICVPDLNPLLKKIGSRIGLGTPWHYLQHRMKNDRAILIFIGVVPEWQNRGVNPVVMRHVLANAKAAGYRVMGNTWIADENGASLAQSEKAGGRALHRLHLYRKAL